MKSRPITVEEGREKILNSIHNMTEYWAKEDRTPDVEGKLFGLAFSIFVLFDGGTLAFPGAKIIPNPHKDDKAYCKEQGENWWPDDIDLGGDLHGQFATMKK